MTTCSRTSTRRSSATTSSTSSCPTTGPSNGGNGDMDLYEGLYTTRMMRRLRPDPIPLDTQARILNAAVRAPDGGNTQRWHFLAVDDRELIRELAGLFRRARAGIRQVQVGDGTDGRDGFRCGPGRARRHDAPAEKFGRLPGRLFRRNSVAPFRFLPSTTSGAPTSIPRFGVRCSPPGQRASAG